MNENNQSVEVGALLNRLFEIMQEGHEKYYAQNEILKKYAGRMIKGDDLISAQNAATAMNEVYRDFLDPIFKFVSLHHPYANQVAFDHYEFNQQNKLANEKIQSSILDPYGIKQ